eukprot:5165663-Alexandrium_andersonii.AAC.1
MAKAAFGRCRCDSSFAKAKSAETTKNSSKLNQLSRPRRTPSYARQAHFGPGTNTEGWRVQANSVCP